jgi:hypothetical protein
MEQNLVPLTATSGSYQKYLIEEVLKGAEIPFAVQERGGLTAWLGKEAPTIFLEFLVPLERLQEAKEILCGNGIVCEVSERLLGRALDEIVKPLLGSSDRDLDRLARFFEVNNKETVKALVELTLEQPGGRPLLEDLFFRLARTEDLNPLRVLARVLGPKADARFFGRLVEEMGSGRKESELAILEVLPELPDTRERTEALAKALRDPILEVREAAGEALYSLGKGDFGYDPTSPAEDRETSIKDFLTIFG